MTDLTDPRVLAALPPEQVAYLKWQVEWTQTARPAQIPPDDLWSECGYLAGRGFGKALALDTPVPTPAGWSTMGALVDGDQVFDEQGRVRRVVKAHEPYTPATLYRLVFSDGSTILADGDHLWATLTYADRKQFLRHGVERVPADWPAFRMPTWDCHGNVTGLRGADVRSTHELAATLIHGRRGDLNHCVPLAAPLQLPDADLPIDPWLLGYWLGNGASRDGSLYAGSYAGDHDDTYVLSRVPPGARATRIEGKGHTRIAVPGLTAQLRELGVLHNKHVPRCYRRASVQQRLELLRGLCDSDAHAAGSHVEFCSTNRDLADGVFELAASLGERPVLYEDRARLNGVDHGERYRVVWRGRTHNPFGLPRKAAQLRPLGRQAMRQDHRMLVSVDPVPVQTVRCITVDSPNALYLVGRGMIPTHNTRVGAEWLARAMFEDPSGYDSYVIAPTYQDVKFTCFEGESGLLSIIPPELLVDYNRTDLTVTIRNIAGGTATARGFTAEKPERLRGPQACRGWFDELAAWQRDEETWDMAMFGMRLGQHPQVLWTTTPKPKELIRKLSAPSAGRVIVRGSTFDNKANLPANFFKQLEQYEGTTIGRQELYGELIDPEEAGIVRRSWFRLWPAKKPLPKLEFIIMSLDTAFTEQTYDKKSGDSDPTACVVLGVFRDKEGTTHLMVLDCWSDRLGMPELIKRVRRELNVAYGDDEDTALIKPMFGGAKPVTSGRKPDLCLIEDKGSGISLRQMLSREGIEAYAYNPGRMDKLARLHVVSHVFARRRVWLPESDKYPGKPRTWVEPMLAQVCSFTGEGSIKHDDYVDALTQAVRLTLDKNLLSVVKPAKKTLDVPPPRGPVSNPYSA